jgi:hypothetical protein
VRLFVSHRIGGAGAFACLLFVYTPSAPAQDASKRVELNLLGKTDTQAGESRRNENIHFNLVDNNFLKELNVRLGTTATIIQEFTPDRSYFGAEFGNATTAPIHVAPILRRQRIHGSLRELHQNSVFSARSFFQVGGVKPARENDYGFQLTAKTWKRAYITLDGGQQRIRGSVNGNVLVPKADERTPLSSNPAIDALIAKWMAAYPKELPNRPDVNPRALNTNSPQTINNNSGGIRLDQYRKENDRFTASYNFISQHVQAFELVAGQNPNTDTKSHRARLTWARTWDYRTTSEFTIGFDRIRSLLVPENNAVGPLVSISGLESLGPQGSIPINRAQNLFREAGLVRRTYGNHTLSAGFGILRRQFNGTESDAHRGYWSFGNDFGNDAITNFRLGLPVQHIISIGTVDRGFRNWESQFFAADNWKVNPRLAVNFGLRYQPVSRPYEVNGVNTIPYGADLNNVAPQFGIAYRAAGVIRIGAGVQYGEIFPVTFQQVRFSPPGSVKLVVTTPDLLNPLGGAHSDTVKGNQYLLDPELATPYEYQYNASWQPDFTGKWKVQIGYVGSRSHKLFLMSYRNRARPVPGIPQTTATINERRPDPRYAEIRWVQNGSQGYYDAARVSLIAPRMHGLTFETAYWFSKTMDLGSGYTNTAYDADSRQSRSQWEDGARADMKGLSNFDQPHSFLFRGEFVAPWKNRWMKDWTLSSVALFKSGTPFELSTGSDGPGFGNVDGNGGDRPNLLDPSILGRTIGNPDTSRILLPRSAFAFMPLGTLRGNLGRNVFRRGGIHNVNSALSRAWPIKNGSKLTFRAESINILNTPQFAQPGLELANANFGQITNTLNDGRTFRFQLMFNW